MRVLVTGATGFVGNAVVRQLAGDGHEVWALSARPGARSLPAARMFRADVRDRAALRPAFAGVRAVCHLAALTNGRESSARAAEYHQVNAESMGTLLDLLAEEGAARPRFVLASTAAVYGTPEGRPVTEEAPTAPGNPYGASKVLAEEALRERGGSGGLTGVVLRPFNVSGAVAGIGDGDESRIIPKALAVAAGRFPALGMNGDGSAVRDFVHVADLARAFALALTAETSGDVETYNVGATPASMSEIVRAVAARTGRPVPVVHNPPVPEAPRVVADTSLIQRQLGWKAEQSTLDQLIADAWSATCS